MSSCKIGEMAAATKKITVNLWLLFLSGSKPFYIVSTRSSLVLSSAVFMFMFLRCPSIFFGTFLCMSCLLSSLVLKKKCF